MVVIKVLLYVKDRWYCEIFHERFEAQTSLKLGEWRKFKKFEDFSLNWVDF